MKTQDLLRTLLSQDGAAILDTQSGMITTLNTSGAYIWHALQQGKTAKAIAANIARDTGEAIETVERDIADFITELGQQHLLSC